MALPKIRLTRVAKQRGVRILGFGAAIVSAAAVLNPVLGLVGGAVSALVLLAADRVSGPTVVKFSRSDWKLDPDRSADSDERIPITLTIDRKRLGRNAKTPMELWMMDGGVLVPIICDYSETPEGDRCFHAQSQEFAADGEVRTG